MITFSCPRCATRYDVGEQLAGKKGRCKKCGHVMSIPAPSRMVAASGMFRLLPEAAFGGERTRIPRGGTVAASRPPAASLPSSVALAPLSSDFRAVDKRAQAAAAKPHIAAYLHESTTVGPYALAEPSRIPRAVQGSSGRPAGLLARLYRGQVGGVLTVLRKVNDFAYLISIPFIVLMLVGIVLKSRPIALGGATGVVLLNIGRLVTGGFAFYVRPFKKSPIEGLLFLIPPYAAYKVATHWKASKKATMRFVEPALTIGIVLLAFAFIPWLSSGAAPEDAPISQRLRAEAGALKSDMREELEGRGSSLDQRLGDLSEKAQRGLNAVQGAGDQSSTATDDEGSPTNAVPR